MYLQSTIHVGKYTIVPWIRHGDDNWVMVSSVKIKRYSASHTLKTAKYFNYHLFIILVIIYLSFWLSIAVSIS